MTDAPSPAPHVLAPSLVIGRDPGADITVDDAEISTHHAELRRSPAGGHLLVDTRSTNGTFVNDVRVTEAVLRPGDVVRLGTRRAFRYDGSTLVPLSAAPVARPTGRPEPLQSVIGQVPARTAYVIGREEGVGLVLDEPTISRRHARVEVAPGGGHVLIDQGSANGTYVNGQRISSRRLAVGDTIQIGPYLLVYDGLALTAPSRQVQGYQVDASGVSRSVRGRTLVQGVNLTIRPNELVALVGGSGAGKSTLLKILAGVSAPTGGSVQYNGTDLYAAGGSFRSVIGYVPQSDIVHAGLPVGRALDYVARLRLPPDLSPLDRQRRIAETLAAVDMAERQHSIISTLSGGERKRVSVALELLANPKVLLLDEPTSGLDAGLDKRLMELLRRLADEGRTVVVVTHSVLHLDRCDRVAFMARGGRLAYQGPPRATLQHFQAADFADCYRAVEAWQDHVPAGPPPAPATQAVAPPRRREPRPPAGRQLAVLTARNVELLVRDHRNALLLLLQAPVLGALLALVAVPHAFSAARVRAPDAQEAAFALANVAVWFGLINAAREISKERAIAMRERLMGVGATPYLLSKLLPMLVLIVIQCALLLAVVVQRLRVPSSGLGLPPAVELLISLCLTGAAGVAAALLVSALVDNEDRAMSLVPYILIPQFLLAGVAFAIHGPARLLEPLTATHWGTRALGGTVRICGSDTATPAFCHARGLAYPTSFAGLAGCWLALVIMALVFLAGAALALRRPIDAR